MHALDTARQLAKDIRESEEYREFSRCKAEIKEIEGLEALLNEYRRLQMNVQMSALAKQPADEEDRSRFQQLGSLLFADSRTSCYLMAEMRLQRMMAEIFGMLTQAAEMQFDFPV